jgi:hypothetical protein
MAVVRQLGQNINSMIKAEIVSEVFASVDNFAQGEDQADDIACVVIRRSSNPKG